METTRLNGTSKWAKSRVILGHLTHGKPVDEEGTSKILETQHWLEMIDSYHRVGTNLQYYHAYWNANETKENFFFWLDEGNGKGVSLDACPRSQLQKERVKYLSIEERRDYMADIIEGKMIWKESHLSVDTFGSDPKEHVDKTSIVDVSDSSSDNDEPTTNRKKNQLKNLTHLSVSHLMEKLMKATSKSYRWMFVTDAMFNFYLAPKNAGVFQHSSFLGGARVTSAGLIKIKQGSIVAISPLSGHYRCTSKHFAQVLRKLKSRGVDVDKVHISKSLAVLWTLEGWSEVKRVVAKKH